MNIFKKFRYWILSRRTRGIIILSFLLTCLSYFINHPLFYGATKSINYRIFEGSTLPANIRHGFPWNFGIGSHGIGDFSIFYFVLDMFFWFIVVGLVISGLTLIKDSSQKSV